MTESTLAARIEAELERDRQARVSEFGAEALAWLAFPPVWTDRVARASGFPERPLSLGELLRRAEAAGWCVQRQAEIRARTPALRLHLLVELAVLGGRRPERALTEIRNVEHEPLRAQLLARLATIADQDLLPRINRAALTISDLAGKAEVFTALVARRHGVAELSDGALKLLSVVPDPVARATGLLRLWKAAPEPKPEWPREFRSVYPRLQNPVLAARLLEQAARWLPKDEVIPLVQRLAGEAPPVALGDLATAAAWAGQFEEALTIAESPPDDRAVLRAYADLLAPVHNAGDQGLLDVVVSRCVGDRAADPVTTSIVLERLAQAGRPKEAQRLAARLITASGGLGATPANVAALQRAAAAILVVRTGGRGLSLVRRSAELAAQLPDPADRVAYLADAVDLARRFDLPDPLDTAPVVAAARSVHDDEDRAQALVRAAVLVGPRDREELRLAGEALELAEQLDEGATVVTFWVPDSARTEVIEELRHQPGFAWVQQTTATVGRRLREVRQAGEPVPEALGRWAELAATAGGDGGPRRAATALDERVARLLDAGDTGQALGWLDTARSLAPLLLGEFETSVVANTRRVELVHRRELDRRRLAEFLPRPALVQAFARLLEQDDNGPWALHYLGVGGVGKTTLIRHLTAEVAMERDVVTSRIDFDHINPDFPRRRPAQLLLELATELGSYAQNQRQMTLFRQAYEQLQEINAAALPGTPPITVSDARLAAAVRTFGGFLQVLERPVVLILDTCEELEKQTAVGGRMEQLEATFALIEALHEVVPGLRVVLAGRRPLAQAGHSWRLADRDREPPTLLPDEKPYLVVHEIRGFDRAEAEEFLHHIKGLDLDEEPLEAILARSADPGAPATLEWTDAEPTGEQPDTPRYNPFDLDHYANWVRAEPTLTAELVAATDRDTYVESRILGRLNHPDVERLLPAVAALGRFDRGMLRPAFDGDEASFADAWRELAATEWIDLQHDAALDTTFLEVDRNLRPRLEAYYRRPEHRGLHQEAARRLGPGLTRLVDERPLDRLGVDHVAAAIRLLPREEAARQVDRLAWKVIEAAAWGWAGRVVERLLADAPELGHPQHPTAAGLRAMLASALVHLDPERDVTELWGSVEEAAPAYPDEGMRRWLALRASLGQRPERFQPIFAALAEETDGRRRQVLVGGLLAAVYRRLDVAEAAGNRTRVLQDPADLERAVLGEAAPVGALTRMLVARTLLLDARFDDAEKAFADAVALAGELGPPPAPWLVADWEPPENLARRIWLEALRAPVKKVGRPPLGPPPIPEGPLGEIDTDRFASAALRRRLGREVVPGEELAAYERLEDLLEIHRPRCQAHRAVPPFFITISYGWLVLGEAERARALLISGESAAIDARDPETTRAINAARLEIVRRFRSDALDPSALIRMAASDDPSDIAAVRAVGALVHEQSRAQQVRRRSTDTPPLPDWIRLHPFGWELGVRQEIRRATLALGSTELAVRAALEPAMDVLGWRRLAELLLEEGELLALEHQGRTIPLDLATSLFELKRDRFGAFAATVTGALARARSGVAAYEGTAGRLRRIVTGLRSEPAASSMPDWPELAKVVDLPSRRAVEFDHSPWQGWLHRLLVALAWAVRPERLSRVRVAIAPRGGLPPELDVREPGSGLMDDQAAGSESGTTTSYEPKAPPVPSEPAGASQVQASEGLPPRTPKPPSEPTGRTRGPETRPVPAREPRKTRRGLVTLTIGLVAVIGFLLVLLVPSVREGIADAGLRGVRRAFTEAFLPLLVGVLSLVALGWRAVQAWLYRRRLSRHVGLSPALVHTGAGGSHLRWTIDDRRAISVRDGASGGSPLTFAPYEQQRDVLPNAVRRALTTGQPPRGVEIDSEPAGQGPPWEAPILLAASDVGLPCWRVSPALPSRASRGRRLLRLRRVRCFVLAPETWWAGVIQKLHGRTRGELPRTVAVQLGTTMGGFNPWPVDDALVLMGTPVETSAGLRLRTTSVAERDTQPAQLIEPGALPYDGFTLVVAMAEPTESLTRVDAEREQTARLRRVAADFVDAGAQAVLCLPAMPQDLAGEVLKVLGGHLRRIRAFGPWELVRVTSRIRKKIAAAGTTDEERAGAKELALEVTVWIRPEQQD